jgi:hypothetical protein
MSGVFLSYSRLDHEVGERVIAGLRGIGVDCWWDEDMPGVPWQEELERQINELGALVVLWTPTSKNSKFVRAEAALALSADKLINVLIGLPQPPFPFNGINGLPLDGWTGREPHNGWKRLVETVEEHLVQVGGAQPGALTGALALRQQDIGRKREALADAEDAYATAKAADADADGAVEAAEAALKTAEEQLAGIGQMRASTNVIRTAQTEFEDARLAMKDAERLRGSAATQLASASRALSRARAALEAMFDVAQVEPTRGEDPTSTSGRAPQASAEAEAPTTLSPAEAPRDEPAPAPRQTAASKPPEREEEAPPEAAPPVAEAPAMLRPAVTGSPAATSRPWLIYAAVAAVAVIGAIWLMLQAKPPPAVTGSSMVEASVAPPSQSATASAPDAAAADAVTAAKAAIVGKWTLQGVSCAYAIKFLVDGETLSIGGTPVTIRSVDADGAIKTGSDSDGDTYAVAGDTLTMSTPDGEKTSYTRCAG